jgi:hypothetical protein
VEKLLDATTAENGLRVAQHGPQTLRPDGLHHRFPRRQTSK